MKKKTAKTTIVVLMLLALSLYFIGGTYARYATEYEGTGSVDVAYWNVSLKNGANAITSPFTLNLTKTADAYVVANKIAPEATVTGELALDLTGTEVAVKVSVEVDEEELQDVAEALGIDPTDISADIELVSGTGSATATAAGSGVYTIKLPSNQAFTSSNGQYTVKVNVKWENNDHDEEDTAAGTKSTTSKLTVPITVTIEQLLTGE